jgi:hypothetical protein
MVIKNVKVSIVSIDSYRKKGYRVVNKNALGELSGLSRQNSRYHDIKRILTKRGDIYVSPSDKKVFLSKKYAL